MKGLRSAGRVSAWLLGLAMAGAQAQNALTPLPASAYFATPSTQDAVLSPDGRHLALTLSQGEQRRGLVILDLAPGGELTRIVEYTDADVVRLVWVNNRRIVFSVGHAGSADARASLSRGLYAVNLDGSDRGMVYPGHANVLRVPAPVEGAPNNEILISGGGSELHWVNVDTRRWTRHEARLRNGTREVWTDSKGEPRVAVVPEELGAEILWRQPGESDWRQLLQARYPDVPFWPHAIDDAGQLYVTQRLDGFEVLSRYDRTRGAPEPEPMVTTPGFDFRGQLFFDRSGVRALGVRTNTDGELTTWFDADSRRLQALADARFPGQSNRISCRRCDRDDAVMLVWSHSDRQPGAMWLYRARPAEGQRPWELIALAQPQLQVRPQAEVRFERIRARDGLELPVWVTVPPGPPKPRPALVLVHGGPWTRGGEWEWRPLQQFLASRGYLVIEPEFRGSTGYGDRHFKAGWKQWGRAMQDDVADALAWAQRRGLASDKACIGGASYGGYATLMGLVRHPEAYRCGIAWFAVTDLELFLDGEWFIYDDVGDLARRHTLPRLVGDLKTERAQIQEVSPLRQAARIRAPLLLGMGEKDLRVPIEHGERLRDAMRAAGNAPVWVSYPAEGHGFALARNSVDWAERMERFLAEHLK